MAHDDWKGPAWHVITRREVGREVNNAVIVAT
eukprot:SAG31_NODE_49984_length_124_cov_20.840000_1_plen_31_part_01